MKDSRKPQRVPPALRGVGAAPEHSVTKDTEVSGGRARPEEPRGWK